MTSSLDVFPYLEYCKNIFLPFSIIFVTTTREISVSCLYYFKTNLYEQERKKDFGTLTPVKIENNKVY